MILNFEYIQILAIEIMESIRVNSSTLDQINTTDSQNTPSESFWDAMLSNAKGWQTLIAGILAMLPASAAAIFVWRQLNEQRIQFLQIQKRDSQKSRLRLSRNLAEISRFLDTSYKKLIEQNFDVREHTIPEGLVDDVLDAGVLSSEENFSFFKEYTTKIQQYSSLCRMYDENKDENNLIKCFSTLAEVDIMTDHLYPFARFEIDKVRAKTISTEEIKSYLLHNLRRGQNISGSNLKELMDINRFD